MKSENALWRAPITAFGPDVRKDEEAHIPSIPGGMGMSLDSLPPVPGTINLKSWAKAPSMSESLPLLTAAMTLETTASLSALVDIVERMVGYTRECAFLFKYSCGLS